MDNKPSMLATVLLLILQVPVGFAVLVVMAMALGGPGAADSIQAWAVLGFLGLIGISPTLLVVYLWKS